MKKIYKKPSISTRTKRAMYRIVRSKIVVQALIVGVLSGALVVLFRICITSFAALIAGYTGTMPNWEKLITLPFIGTIGGLIAGLLIYKIAPESRGSGIPQVKYILTRIGQRIRVRTVPVKFFAGIAGIGTGLSLGREGPSVQMGAGAGALVARIFKANEKERNKLIAAGAGAAIGATFNAPIAGAIFVLEEPVQAFSAKLLFPVLLATVTAATLARAWLGNNPAFNVTLKRMPVRLESIPLFVVLGILTGILGVLFVRNIFINLKLFDTMKRIPQWVKPGIAGFLVGCIGVLLPYATGAGNDAVENLLRGHFGLVMILLIFVGKFFLTAFCFGSGAAGGLFLPVLMLGAFLGYLVGAIGHGFFGIAIDPTMVALVGMGSFLAAVARTPITAVVIVFEMTGDYNHILPIMLSAAIADVIAEKFRSPAIYMILMRRMFSGTKRSGTIAQTPASTKAPTPTPTMMARP